MPVDATWIVAFFAPAEPGTKATSMRQVLPCSNTLPGMHAPVSEKSDAWLPMVLTTLSVTPPGPWFSNCTD